MQVNQDYEDLFKILNAYKVKYIVVGAYAVIYHTQPRFTKDMDVWIIPEKNNLDEVYNALKEFGAPLHGIKPKDFNDKSMILQIGVAPIRIDIMLDVPGVSFKKAWQNKKKVKYGKTPIYVLGKDDLIDVKKKAGRLQDQLDIDKLIKGG